MALVKPAMNVSPKVEIKETKTPEVKLVKKDSKMIYDETGGFISELIQFDIFVKRQRELILSDEYDLIFKSLHHKERDFIFTSLEREYISKAFDEFVSHTKSLMTEGKEKASIEEVIKSLMKDENGKEKALAFIEAMGNENKEDIEINIEPIKFSEAKKILQDNIHMLCDMLLLSLKEIARY